MKADCSQRQEWLTRKERGCIPVMKLIVWIALRLGRRVARLLIYPACLYYLIFSPKSRTASKDYLSKVLDHPPTFRHVFRHYYTFAACVLDRIFLLNDRTDLFDIQIHNENIVTNIVNDGGGCLLVGAHVGSFEVLRTVGRTQPNLRVSMVMYEDNARKINAVLTAINPALSMDIIGLGKSNSLIMVEERLLQGNLVGVLADRSLENEGQISYPFLGHQASFPVGPFRMAAILKRPIVLMFGLYQGGNQYHVYFEHLSEQPDQSLEDIMSKYVARLEYYCRMAPYNWFNFYNFWK